MTSSTTCARCSAALQACYGDVQAGGCAQLPLPLDVVRGAVERALDDPARGGVPGGGVTFSSMSSLRSLPYRVVCAIGLNDGAFPTAARPAEFDLMARQPSAAATANAAPTNATCSSTCCSRRARRCT